jgi:hypothetical protein
MITRAKKSVLNGSRLSPFRFRHFGRELPRQRPKKQVPKAMIGRRLSQEEAKKLLAKFVCPRAGFGATVELIPAQASLVHRQSLHKH